MIDKNIFIPLPHVIEEVEKYHQPDLNESVPLQLPLPLPSERKPEPEKHGGSVIVIQL